VDGAPCQRALDRAKLSAVDDDAASSPTAVREALEIRVRGRVQGVGFRPAVYRLARELGLGGEVCNDADGVLIHVAGPPTALRSFLDRLAREPPPLARIEAIESRPHAGELPRAFRIVESSAGQARTQIAPDAVVCAACAAEVIDPASRRFRYPFAACTHCGPRLSVVTGVPYDRARTTLAAFPLCPACAAEYADPGDRRFHAEATACHRCGPRAKLQRLDGQPVLFERASTRDAIDAAVASIARGEIVAIKGLGGYHLACDATRPDVVDRLRARKRRDAKPFALMARDLAVIRRYCRVSVEEEAALQSAEGPIVLLRADGPDALPAAIAPGLGLLGFMLPTTPLHLLIVQHLDRPVVMTSGNLSDEPPVTADAEVERRLGAIADGALVHDRPIESRVDDSVVRVMAGRARLLRRSRGHAPSPIRLPVGFEAAPPLLAFGGELKATFCLLREGEAIVSQHQGDLEDSGTFDDYRRSLDLYARIFDHAPAALVVDRHPEYLSTKLGRARALAEGLPLVEVQHHHAHLASCLAENGRPLDGPPVLGVLLDGLGLGDDGTLWGGEFLLGDYRAYQRVGTLKPVAMLGGAQAAREPWRNLYAQLVAGLGWAAFSARFGDLALHAQLDARPRALLDGMLRARLASPLASSCGRLFDAVAAAIGLCFERQAYEGQAGALLEACVDEGALRGEDEALAYPMTLPELPGRAIPCIEPLPMWSALLGDLARRTSPGVMAARFHRGLARAIAAMVEKAAGPGGERRFDTVALSGGCFQNRVLFEEVERRITARGFRVLSQARVPPNDGGLSLGQAAIAAARLLGPRRQTGEG
jgi:hydrogenase maturation protein HypF